MAVLKRKPTPVPLWLYFLKSCQTLNNFGCISIPIDLVPISGRGPEQVIQLLWACVFCRHKRNISTDSQFRHNMRTNAFNPVWTTGFHKLPSFCSSPPPWHLILQCIHQWMELDWAGLPPVFSCVTCKGKSPAEMEQLGCTRGGIWSSASSNLRYQVVYWQKKRTQE